MNMDLQSGKMNDEKLIESVHEYQVLYDSSHPKYMDISLKNGIWNEIGEEMKTDGQTCKLRWNNIRDTYRKSLKKSVTASGIPGKKIKSYKYANNLNFLLKYFDEWEAAGNAENQEVRQDGEAQQEESESEEGNPEISLRDLQTLLASSLAQRNEKIPTPVNPKRQRHSDNYLAPQQTAAAQLIDYFIRQQESRVEPPHPVDAFLAALAPPLKALSPYHWHLAKSEIFSTVQKFELKSILEHSSTEESASKASNPSTSS